MSGRVFLIMQPSVKRDGSAPDLTPLKEHGEVTVLVHAGESPRFHPAQCRDKLIERLKTFDPDKDMLAWAGGDTLAAVLVGAILADQLWEEEAPEITWLRYERAWDGDRRRQDAVGARYVPIRVPLLPPLSSDATQATLLPENANADKRR